MKKKRNSNHRDKMTAEVSYPIIAGIVGAGVAPMWGLLVWILKVQRASCERLTKMETENKYEHGNENKI